MFTRDELLAKYNITEEEFEHAEMTWDDLIYIYNDFKENHYCKYQDILSDFVQEYLQDIDKKDYIRFELE